MTWLAIGTNTLIQRRTPKDLIGRVDSFAELAVSAPNVAFIALGSLLVSVVDYRLLVVGMALVMTTGGTWLVTRREQRREDHAARLAGGGCVRSDSREAVEVACLAVVVSDVDGLEADFGQDSLTGCVFHRRVRVQRYFGGVVAVPPHQCFCDLGRQALSPLVTVQGVAQLSTGPVRAEARAADQVGVVVGDAPLGPSPPRVLVDVVVDECSCLVAGFGPAVADEPHGHRVGVDVQQVIDVTG